MFFLVALPLLLLAGILAPLLLASRLAGRVRAAAGIPLLLAILLWLAAGPALPLQATLWPGAAQIGLPSWSWGVDGPAWWLSLVLLLLLLLAVAGPAPLAPAEMAWPLTLALAGLPALWSDSLAGLLPAWSLLAVVWAGLTLLAGRAGVDCARLRPPLTALIAAVALLWLGAALERGWPAVAGAVMLLVVPGRVWWQGTEKEQVPAGGWFGPLVPAAAGLTLLARLAGGAGDAFALQPLPALALLPLSAAALLGLLLAVWLAWHRIGQGAASMAAALTLWQGSLALLAALWAGPEAVWAEGRVLLLAVALLGLFALPVETTPRPVRQGAAWLVAAAVAGVPFTAAFAGRAALYQAWLADGRPVLLLVVALLHLPLAAAALLAGQAWPGRHEEGRVNWSLLARRGRLWAWLLPALLLLWPAGVGKVPFGVYGAVLLPALGAVFLSRQAARAGEWLAVARQGLQFPGPPSWPAQAWQEMVALAAAALREAAVILEGEGGILWLLLLLVVFWLALAG